MCDARAGENVTAGVDDKRSWTVSSLGFNRSVALAIKCCGHDSCSMVDICVVVPGLAYRCVQIHLSDEPRVRLLRSCYPQHVETQE